MFIYWRASEARETVLGVDNAKSGICYIYTSGVLEHKWRASLKTILFLLNSNTEATENKVQFLNFAYRVKGFQCHSNNSLQLLELKEKTTTTKQYALFKSFLCDIL